MTRSNRKPADDKGKGSASRRGKDTLVNLDDMFNR